MDLDLTCVASLLVLYDEQHHGRAATRLKLTPSALTKRIQRLERQVGVPLVARDTAGAAEPTAAGYRFRSAAAQLLRNASAAREAALAPPARGRHVVVLAVPAGLAYLRKMLPRVMTEVRENWPETRLVCRQLPFPEMISSLLGGEVDVVWSAAPVRHPGVASIPLNTTITRVGVVSARHELAGAREVDVTEFAGFPMLYNPTAPDEWMSVFYLGDVRPRTDAHLVAVGVDDPAGVYREAMRGSAVTVGDAVFTDLVGPGVHALTLTGLPPVCVHAAYLRREHRGTVHSLVGALATETARSLSPAPESGFTT